MQKTDAELVNALVQLEVDGSFQAVKVWVQSSFHAQLTGNIDLRGEEATRGQGYAEALRDILRVMKDPRKLAEKFQR
jgi:hypothetical protein